MSRQKPSEASASPTRAERGRWSAGRKVSVVLELLRGAELESVSRRHGVTAATIPAWRDDFLASGEAGLKRRETHVDDEETQRLKRVVAEQAATSELLREKIRHLEANSLWAGGGRSDEPADFALHAGTLRITRELRVGALPRSTFYAQAARTQPSTGRRGRTPTLEDAALLTQIRPVIAESPFHGEGHPKIWARLRTLKGVRTSMRRVLRVMREADLLAPARGPEGSPSSNARPTGPS